MGTLRGLLPVLPFGPPARSAKETNGARE